ncbi:helicase HerA domain-containing protein [Paracraurococcus lichenis]|uniref:ATP-binding protein n=1 Tax=Paracraurococcus lichenis TaxID=3064888 RepID=A0ABT9DVH6_9PROT|nr:ATP-binding protein [Paracraurococcus sp. LOR1-02]MDO9707906.1 ATP-binding protein [Paracraurococcus sp. LOR1-02]
MAVSIELGRTDNGQPALLDLEELLATRLLVQGNSGCGKSHLLRRLLERSAPFVQQAVIDPEGDFVSLAERFGHLVIDAAEHTEASLAHAGERVRQHRVSVVLNLEGVDIEGQMRRAAAFLDGLFAAERRYWTPVLVVVDEAQLFAPSGGVEVAEETRRAALGAMTDLMCRGRKRGLAGVIATQRLAKLAKNVAAEASNFLMGRTFLDIDMARAADLLGMEKRQAEMFRDLERGRFMALGPALARRPLAMRIGAVETESRGAGPGLMPLPETPPEAAHALILAPAPAGEPVRPRRPPPPPPADILAQLAAARPAAPASLPPPTPEEAAARRRAQLAVLGAVLGTEGPVRKRPEELLPLVRHQWSLERLAGPPPDIAAIRRLLPLVRAGITEETEAHPDWPRALDSAAALLEREVPLFLMLAQAALAGAPCPGTEALKAVYGTSSTSLLTTALKRLEERGCIAILLQAGAGRVVAIPGPGWETAPGDPEAAVA